MNNYYQFAKNYRDKSKKTIKKGLGFPEFIQLQPKIISEGAYRLNQEERDEH